MKLFLSSRGIPLHVQAAFGGFFRHDLHEVKIAYIPNARDVKDGISQTFLDLQALTKLQVVDLQDFRGQAEKLRQTLADYDAVWVAGGNAFFLRYMMRESGFDQIIAGLVENGLVYAGSSAGSIVAGPTLRHFDLLDEPERSPEVIWQGLSLTEIVIIPHVNDPRYQEGAMKIKEKLLRNHDWPVISLHDGQVVMINDDDWQILS